MYRPFKPYSYNSHQAGSSRNANRNNHRVFQPEYSQPYTCSRIRNNYHSYYNGPNKQCAPQSSRPWKQKQKTFEKVKPAKAPKNEIKNDETKAQPTWNRADAIKAIELEEECNRTRSNQYILRFPDPFIDKNTIKGYSSAIVDVRVQQPITPRFVYITLKPDMDHQKIISELSRIPFGTGFLKVEPSITPSNQHLSPEDIDPCTIFLGNIHPSTSIKVIKEGVHKAHRVDVGFAKKHKFGRYAFAKFRNPADAREAFSLLKENNSMNDTDLIVRFRRLKGSIVSNGLDGPKEIQKELNQTPTVNRNETDIIDITNDDDCNKIQSVQIKKEPEENKTSEEIPNTPEDITEKLFTNDLFDWDKLRLQEISRYETKPDINKLPFFNTSNSSLSLDLSPANYDINTELDELFNQLDSDFSYVFNDDFEF